MENKICRMRMPRETFAISTIDPASGEIRMRRTHPMINNFNVSIICVCRCNMDIKFVWSGTDAKALVYYCTDYITKTSLSFHDTFSLVQKAVRGNENSSATENSVDKARKLVLRCYNSLASQQELSGVQVATYLMDLGDHYTSHEFANIFLISIERYLQNELNQARAASSPSSTIVSISNTHANQLIENEDEENLSAGEEQFFIEHSADPQKLVLVNLRVDYQYRSQALHSLCLYEFVSFFHRKLFTKTDREIVDRQSTSAAEHQPGPGRPLQERHLFMLEHPQESSHGIIKRAKSVVPVLIGPQVPRHDREETRERYSRAIATLFLPWRSVHDLCRHEQSWSAALSERKGNISIESRHIINNIQLLHECKKDRDEHLQQVLAKAQINDEIDPRLFPRNMRIDSDEEDDDEDGTDQTETHLNFLSGVSNDNGTSAISFVSEREQLYHNESLNCLDALERFASRTGQLVAAL